jgi:SAM-dependent methyltransferase
MQILDAGCGTGETTTWLLDEIAHNGRVVGVDLAAAHTAAARAHVPPDALLAQADLMAAPFRHASFDLIWCANTLHHLRDPLQGVLALARLLKPGGCIALIQSAFLPEMYFAWDARLERLVTEAVRRYYRDRYGLSESDLTAIRSLVGHLRQAKLERVAAHSYLIERISPLSAADEAYLLEAIFRGTWDERLRPYLADDDYSRLARLCDPQHREFALRRPDFHFLQSLTLITGQVPTDP